MKKRQFIVVGLGRFGRALAETLYASGEDVLAVDSDSQIVEDIRDNVTHAAQADVMDIETLEALGVRNFDVAIITIGSDIKSSCMATMLMKELGIKTIMAKASDEIHGRMLERLGADKVIFPERDMGRRVAHNLITANIMDYIEISPDYSLSEIKPLNEWLGKSLSQLSLRRKFGMNVIAIKNQDKLDAEPKPETVIQDGDVLLVITSEDTLSRLGKLR